METLTKIQRPSQTKLQPVDISIKAVQIPKFDALSSNTLTKDKYLSEFSTEEDKQKVIKNLGLGNNFKVVGEFNSLDELNSNVPKGNESEAYLVGSDIYVWSEPLEKFYKYAIDITDKRVIVIRDLESISEKVLYNTLNEVVDYKNYSYYGIWNGETYLLSVSKTARGYSLSFTEPDALNIISVWKDEQGYDYTWNRTLLV